MLNPVFHVRYARCGPTDVGPPMVDTPNRIESLLDQGEFLTRLARALVRDESLADDVVQDTWLAALRTPPEGDTRSWFAVVARNLVRRRARGTARRERRERSAARSELGPSPEEIQHRESIRGLVVEKVLALPEIYRTVVLLRFFEGWKPRRIAREMGCPIETVKTRLKRALEHLRDDLDRENEGQRAVWALGLIQAGRLTSPSAPLAKGVLLLSMKAKIVAGILLVGLAATALILLHQADHARTPLALTGEGHSGAVRSDKVALSLPESERRSLVSSAPPRADHALSAHDALVCLLDFERSRLEDPDPSIEYLCAHDSGFGAYLASRLKESPEADKKAVAILWAIARCPNDSAEMANHILEWAKIRENDLFGYLTMEALLARNGEISRAAALQFADRQYGQYARDKSRANQEQRQELMRIIEHLTQSHVVESVPLLLKISDELEPVVAKSDAEIGQMTLTEREAASMPYLRNELPKSAIIALSKLGDQDANNALIRMATDDSNPTRQDIALDGIIGALRNGAGSELTEQLKAWVFGTLEVSARSPESFETCAALRLAGFYGDEALPYLMPDGKASVAEEGWSAGARLEGLAVFASHTGNEEAIATLSSTVASNQLPYGDEYYQAEAHASFLRALGRLKNATIDDSIDKHILSVGTVVQERLLGSLPKEFWEARPRLLEGMASQLAKLDRGSVSATEKVMSYIKDVSPDPASTLDLLRASPDKRVSGLAQTVADKWAIGLGLERNDPAEIVRLARSYRSCEYSVRLAVQDALRQVGKAEGIPIDTVRRLGEDLSIPLSLRCRMFWGVIERKGSEADECVIQAAPKLLAEVGSPAECSAVCSLLLAFSDSHPDQRAHLGKSLAAWSNSTTKAMCSTSKCSEDVLAGLGLE